MNLILVSLFQRNINVLFVKSIRILTQILKFIFIDHISQILGSRIWKMVVNKVNNFTIELSKLWAKSNRKHSRFRYANNLWLENEFIMPYILQAVSSSSTENCMCRVSVVLHACFGSQSFNTWYRCNTFCLITHRLVLIIFKNLVWLYNNIVK